LVIPSINCPDFKTAENYIRKAEKFAKWIHIDVSDGEFSNTTSWGSPEELRSLNTNLNVEVHLMVEDPEDVIEKWFDAGAKRAIVHLQSMKDPKKFIDIANEYNAEIMLALDPSIDIDKALPFLSAFEHFQVLAVYPGPSGQKFKEESIDKIRALRERRPTATIEVDGGVNESTGKLAADAGANVLVSGNYIFGSPDPKFAYDRLNSIF